MIQIFGKTNTMETASTQFVKSESSVRSYWTVDLQHIAQLQECWKTIDMRKVKQQWHVFAPMQIFSKFESFNLKEINYFFSFKRSEHFVFSKHIRC